ncbi:MAG: hypothetical protein FJZ01_06360 [Candidatus Sericytochromatia bacterium]|nr:hypothetical protein [Candidatus Tanganyikabacteria bacterium]
MASIPGIQVVNGPKVQPDVMVRLRPGAEAPAIAAAKQNGAEDVFVRIGEDTYVGSKRVGGSPVKSGQAVELAGRIGKVIAVDDDQRGKREFTRVSVELVSAVAALGAGLFGFTALLVGLSGAGFLALGLGVLLMAAAVALYYLGTRLRDWLTQQLGERADLERLQAFGDAVVD